MNISVDSPDKPKALFILAHGAGADKDSDFMMVMAKLLCERGVKVLRFNFPYMLKAKETGKRRPPDRMPTLLESYTQVIADVDKNLPLFIGGKSMGGRVASMLEKDDRVRGIVCLGYPFHPPGKPEKHRTAHLLTATKPILIVQGERDTFGSRERVAGYSLPQSINVKFLPAGDHSFVPLKSSGFTQAEHLQSSAALIAEFMDKLI
ncbi:alpha/beta family hydrolase [Aliiglaciecola sp. LCG003]|uniref:alpha/beta family hydrolase n=1 Tax=Aliiglaciecola sp. LCG003 TaxID=3053655 RepID=UPI0025723749|nr:alpha/beta family hydrolase [Aliiglaciecola sp. LCG003]WJG08242.1 alpha/beta fold hydrolase [Aliiglaciecola sp. LCG003]